MLLITNHGSGEGTRLGMWCVGGGKHYGLVGLLGQNIGGGFFERERVGEKTDLSR